MEIIEGISFKQLEKEDKKNLLMHWFHYYGKVPYTLEDLDNFSVLAQEQPDEIFDYIVGNFINYNSVEPTLLIISMRLDKMDELFNSLPDGTKGSEEFCMAYKAASDELTDELVRTYNDPEPDIPMDIEEAVTKIFTMESSNGQFKK